MTDEPKDWFTEAHDPEHGTYYNMTKEGFALLVMGWDDPKSRQFQIEFTKKFLEMEAKLGPGNAQTKQLRKQLRTVPTLGVSQAATLFKVEMIKKFVEMEAKLGPGARTNKFWASWLPK
jgi:phage regulator Rha-like protein